MASSVEITLTNAADGKSFSGAAHRLGMGSSATFVNSGSTPAVARSGIIPSGGTPFDVTVLGTPAMKVNVKAGSAVVQAASATGGAFTVNNPSATDIDIATSDPSNPRIDLIVIRVLADGNGANTKAWVERMTGTPAPSPARPSIASPPTNTHYFPLAQVRVEAAASTIVAGKVTKLAGTDGVWTAAPGGLVPVSNTTDGATLPLFTPFILPTGEQWIRHPNGTSYPQGFMTRALTFQNYVTNPAGDINVFHSKYENGVRADSPFPNACLGAMVINNWSPSTYNVPVWFTCSNYTASFATFRAYTFQSGAVGAMVNSAVSAVGLSWGW